MPIKFRCNYCRQFLGISRAQAGGIVDCPTCGRSIRVPHLDGTLQPLPEPELNLQDAHLARALEELARLGSSDPQPVARTGKSDEEFEEEIENELPQLIPEPIPIEVPIPPTPIAIHPPMNDDEIAEPPTTPSDRQDAKRHEQNLLAELASLAPVDEQIPAETPQKPNPERRPIPVRSSMPRVALMFGITFVAGMLFERFVKLLEFKPAVSQGAPSTTPEPVAKSSQLTGRITYKSADGSSQPDRGARIIAFPQQKIGEVRLSVVGFRPADGEADAKFATAAIQALGGAMTTADDSGQYRLDIPAGTYQLLILSHFQSRNEQAAVDPVLQKLLATYFEKPDDLLGRIKYEFGPLKVKGTGDVRDQSF
ncbi:MAG: hypothetical protein WCJ09_17400 [Planctomycetota bacterium]